MKNPESRIVQGERLRQMRKRRGLTQQQVATVVGYHRQRISDLERGIRSIGEIPLEKAAKYAKAVDVSITAFGYVGTRDWERVEYCDLDRLTGYMEEMQDARDILVCTRGVDSYLVPDEFVDWSERSRLEKLGWPEDRIGPRLEHWRNYVSKQRCARRTSNYRHRIIAPEEFFQRAFSQENHWVDAIKENLDEWNQATALGLIQQSYWGVVEDMVKKVNPLSSWDKVVITDTNLAMIRPSREWFLFTRDIGVINLLRASVNNLAPLVGYNFPTDEDATLDDFESSSERASKRLVAIARNVQSAQK